MFFRLFRQCGAHLAGRNPVGRLLAGWLVLLTLLGGYWLHLHQTHVSLLEQAQTLTHLRGQQTAHALALQTNALLRKIDYLTGHLTDHWTQDEDKKAREALLRAHLALPDGALSSVSVTDANGLVLYSTLAGRSGAPTEPQDTSDRTYFRAHLHGVTPQLFVGQPVRDRVSGEWTVPFSRPLIRNGTFAGVVIVAVSSAHLSRNLRALYPNAEDVAALVLGSGRFMAHSGPLEVALETSVPADRPYLVHPDLEEGSFTAVAPVDGVERYYAWHRVPGYPVVAAIGLSVETTFATVQKTVRDSRTQNALGSLLILLSALLFSALWLRHARQASELAQARERMEKLVTHVPGFLYQFLLTADGQSSMPYCSPGVEALFGVTPEALGHNAAPLFERIHPDDLAPVHETIQRSVAKLMPWRAEYRILDPQGHTRWLLGESNPEPTEDGGILWHGYIRDVTDEHLAAERLRENEQRLRQAIGAVGDGLWAWDLENDELTLDERSNEMLGRPGIETTDPAADIFALVHPFDHTADHQEQYANIFANPDKPLSGSFRLRKTSGEWVWVRTRGRVVDRDGQGRPVRVVGTFSDITARVADAQLRRALLDHSVAAIALMDPQRRILKANGRASAIFAPPGRNLADMEAPQFHASPQHEASMAEHYRRLRETGQINLELPLLDNRGTERWFDAHAVMLDPTDPQSKVVWTLIDISDKRDARAALAAEQLRLRTVLERFPGGVLIEDENGIISSANQGLCELLSIPGLPGELIGLQHETLCMRLGTERAGWLHQPAPDSTGEKRRSIEVDSESGGTMEIDWLPIEHEGRRLGRVWLLRDITERKTRERRLYELAATDALTGLPNRRSFMACLDAAIDALQREPERRGALLMLDLDHFKHINDSFGHGTGDDVLRHVSHLIRQSLRQQDDAARLGGEEFAALLHDVSLDEARALAERLRQAVENSPAATVSGAIRFTTSIGLTPLTGRDPARLLSRADRALYNAKSAGRNRVCLLDEGAD